MQIRSVGINLGNTTFHLAAFGASGKVLVEEKFTRKQLLAFTASLQTPRIGLEACRSASSRQCTTPARTRRAVDCGSSSSPFVKCDKNDFVDAEAIAEAVEHRDRAEGSLTHLNSLHALISASKIIS